MAIKHLTLDNLAHLARNGASLTVEAGRWTSEDLAQIARNLKLGAQLKITNSQHLTCEQMAHVARNGNVFFE